jgi:transcriptional regulator with XRE-family HTH domain
MNLGDFVREKRKEAGISLQALAETTGVDIGTISRIENSRTKATLQSTARLCSGLGVTPNELAQVLGILQPDTSQTQEQSTTQSGASLAGNTESSDTPESEKEHPSQENFVLTEQDVLSYLILFQEHPDAARTWLVEQLNHIIGRQSSDQYGRKIEEEIPQLIPEDVDKLTAPPSVYRFRLEYPRFLPAHTILEIYRQRGILMPADADVYIRQSRHEFAKRGGHRVGDILNRLDAAAIERTKLEDAVTLDAELKMRGELLGLLLSTSTFTDRLSQHLAQGERLKARPSAQDNKEVRLARSLVLTSRWVHYYYQFDPAWLMSLRRLMR